MNLTVLLGRITKEIVPSFAPNTGLAVSRFTLAVDRQGKDKGADFISCVAFGKTAETIAQYFNKGNRILIQGHIQTGSYDGKNGKVYTTDVIVDRFKFIDKKDKQEAEIPVTSFAGTPYENDGMEEVDSSDIPW